MIKRFNEFINEGLWKSGFERSENKNTRLEDKIPFDEYLDKIEWVDLGNRNVLYAKYDFPFDFRYTEKNMLTLEDIDVIKSHLPNGVSIMTHSQFDWIKKNCNVKQFVEEQDKNQVLFSTYIQCIGKTNESVYLNLLRTNGLQRTLYYTGETDVYGTTWFKIQEVIGCFPPHIDKYIDKCSQYTLKNKKLHIKLVKKK